MKKIISLMAILAIILVGGNVYAGTVANASVGGDLTVTDATTGDLVFSPSPGMLLSCTTSDTAFTLVSGNQKAEANAICVMVYSGGPTIYQDAQDLSSVAAGTGLNGHGTAAGTIDSGFTARN